MRYYILVAFLLGFVAGALCISLTPKQASRPVHKAHADGSCQKCGRADGHAGFFAKMPCMCKAQDTRCIWDCTCDF